MKNALVTGAVAAWAIAAWASAASAHRGPAAVLSLLAWDGEDAGVLLLTEGLALRRCAAWQYVCPALWDSDMIAQAARIPEGPIVVGAPKGIFLLGPDGVVRPHPDPAAAKPVIRFARSGAQLYALRARSDGSELIRIGAESIEVVWSDSAVWNAIAGSDTELHLLRHESEMRILHHARVSPAGETIALAQAAGPESVIELRPMVTGGQLYITAITFTGQELGRIDQGAWVTDCKGGNNISGPVDRDGQLFATIDNNLVTLENGCANVIATPETVNAVGEAAGRGYACTRSGASQLSAAGLDAPVFHLGELEAPDFGLVPAEKRPMCAAQWNRFQEDLFALGVTTGTVRTDGTEPSACDAPPNSGEIQAGVGGSAASPGGAPAPTPPVSAKDQGCATVARDPAASSSWLGWGATACALVWLRSRRRRIRSS